MHNETYTLAMQPLNSADKNPKGFHVLFHIVTGKNSIYLFLHMQFPANSFKIK